MGEGNTATRDHGGVGGTHCYAEVWEYGVAGVGKAAYLSVVGCALDLCIVGGCDLGVNEEEGSTGVCGVGVSLDYSRAIG